MIRILLFIFSIGLGIDSFGQTSNDYYKSGMEAVQNGKYEIAIDMFTRSIDLNSKNIEALAERGMSKYFLKDDSGALKDFDYALKIDKFHSYALLGRGFAKGSIGNSIGAIEDLTKVIENPPSVIGNLVHPKHVEEINGRLKELDDKYKNWAYRARGKYKSKLGDLRGAIQDFNKALEYNSVDSEVYYLRAMSKQDLDDLNGCIVDLDRAIEINPKDASYYIQRGLVFLKIGMTERGCLDLSKAGELGYGSVYEIITEFCK